MKPTQWMHSLSIDADKTNVKQPISVGRARVEPRWAEEVNAQSNIMIMHEINNQRLILIFLCYVLYILS